MCIDTVITHLKAKIFKKVPPNVPKLGVPDIKDTAITNKD